MENIQKWISIVVVSKLENFLIIIQKSFYKSVNKLKPCTWIVISLEGIRKASIVIRLEYHFNLKNIRKSIAKKYVRELWKELYNQESETALEIEIYKHLKFLMKK